MAFFPPFALQAPKKMNRGIRFISAMEKRTSGPEKRDMSCCGVIHLLYRVVLFFAYESLSLALKLWGKQRGHELARSGKVVVRDRESRCGRFFGSRAHWQGPQNGRWADES